MASGDVMHSRTAVAPAELPYGAALTSSGRISRTRVLDGLFEGPPFSDRDMIDLDDALTEATRATKVRFNVYVADAADPAVTTDAVFPTTPESSNSVLVAVYPNQRAIEIRSGRGVADRVDNRIAQLGVTAAISSFGQGDLIDGIISAIRVMANAITAP
ncbi:DUF5130 family protein [Rhodococcus sp. CSLK01-03]|uniref:DUF5130 domain-containing protein n=2 Tax=Rhodococcus TaxID=1827 RepID=A0A0M8PK64_RHORH|nr:MULTISPECIES: DUF5130 family protein [Rhodococcus]KOS53338.1 hypothetical protein Z051_26145 [Rhodococcus rhodochrous KG-21]MDM7487476.1 DUF5130 family protein [Rhodococcus indonesiensis]